MVEEIMTVVWYCVRCGDCGETQMVVGLCGWGAYLELGRSHSRLCPGCDGDAPRCLRFRKPSHSDSDWEWEKAVAKKRAADRIRREKSSFIIV